MSSSSLRQVWLLNGRAFGTSGWTAYLPFQVWPTKKFQKVKQGQVLNQEEGFCGTGTDALPMFPCTMLQVEERIQEQGWAWPQHRDLSRLLGLRRLNAGSQSKRLAVEMDGGYVI